METIRLDSIDAYNKVYGLPTYHPLVTVVDLKEAKKLVNHVRIDYGVYALFLKNGTSCSIRYGRKEYDYQEGSVVSFSPGQLIEVDMDRDEISPDVIGLLFHPDLIYGTLLGERIKSYGFFEYSQREALHLSASERALFLESIDKIKREVQYPVDHHSADVIAANINLLLEYMNRFYDRQFITRHKVNSDIARNFENELREYFRSEKSRDGLPSVAYFADRLNLSAGYFSDLIRKELGLPPKTIIDNHMIEVAKHRLMATDEDISIIAYDLGFQYPQHFTRHFKRITGQSPTRFRKISEN